MLTKTRKQEYTMEKLSDEDRKILRDSLKKAFSVLNKIKGVNAKEAERLMQELNKLNTEANQTELFF